MSKPLISFFSFTRWKLKKNRSSKISYWPYNSSFSRKIPIWPLIKFSSCLRERTYFSSLSHSTRSSNRHSSIRRSSNRRKTSNSNPITPSAKKPTKNKKTNFLSKNFGFSTKIWRKGLPRENWKKYLKNQTLFVSKWTRSKISIKKKKRIKRMTISGALAKNPALVERKTWKSTPTVVFKKCFTAPTHN